VGRARAALEDLAYDHAGVVSVEQRRDRDGVFFLVSVLAGPGGLPADFHTQIMNVPIRVVTVQTPAVLATE